jgi:hypothetical protein
MLSFLIEPIEVSCHDNQIMIFLSQKLGEGRTNSDGRAGY